MLSLGMFVGFAGAAVAQESAPKPPLPPEPTQVRPVPFTPASRANAGSPFVQLGPKLPSPLPPAVAQAQPPEPTGPPVRPVPLAPTFTPAPVALAPAATTVTSQVPPPPQQPASYLTWDSESKEYTAKVGDTNAHFTFYLTNVSSEMVLVNSVRTSCGCTVAQLPEQPWRLAPGTNGPIQVTVNLQGKSGTIVKSVTVDSTTGIKSLLVRVNIPVPQPVAGQPQPQPTGDVDRLRNMQMTLADRQVVFKNDCAKCHAEPAHGKSGKELYQAACAICHDSPHRATMVPDLHALKHPTNAEHWKKWIVSGRVGSMMPAFSTAEGGPLTDAQIGSLVEYLAQAIPSAPQPGTVTQAPVLENVPAFPPVPGK